MATGGPGAADDRRDDDVDAPGGVDDQFRSLLEGLRTTLPGVQLITAFLLTLPLYERFGDLSDMERVAYYLAFVSSLLGSLLLMAPSSHQRLRTHDAGITRRSKRHLEVAVRLSVAGTLAFAVAITAVAFLVSSMVLDTWWAIGLTLLVTGVGSWSWFYLPLVSFERDD